MAEASGEPFKYTRSEIRILFGFRQTAFRKLEIKAGIIPPENGALPIGNKRDYDAEQLAKLARMIEGRLGRSNLSYEAGANIEAVRAERKALCAYFIDREAGVQKLFLLALEQPLSEMAEALLRREEPKYSPHDWVKGRLLRTILVNNTPNRSNALVQSTKPVSTEATVY